MDTICKDIKVCSHLPVFCKLSEQHWTSLYSFSRRFYRFYPKRLKPSAFNAVLFLHNSSLLHIDEEKSVWTVDNNFCKLCFEDKFQERFMWLLNYTCW